MSGPRDYDEVRSGERPSGTAPTDRPLSAGAAPPPGFRDDGRVTLWNPVDLAAPVPRAGEDLWTLERDAARCFVDSPLPPTRAPFLS